MGLNSAEQLRAARALLRLTQAELSEISGVSAPTIKRLEAGTGRLNVHAETLERLNKALSEESIRFFSDGGPGVQKMES